MDDKVPNASMDPNFVNAWECMEKYFGLLPFQLTLDVQDDEQNAAAEVIRKKFLYVVSPLAFGHDYPNKLFSKTAEYVNLYRASPLNADNHSSEIELHELRLITLAMNMVKMFGDLEMSGFFKAKGMDFDSVIKIKDPESLLRFGKHQISTLGFPEFWLSDDVIVLLFVIAFLIGHDQKFQTEVLQQVTRIEDEHTEEVDRLFLAGSEAHTKGKYNEVLRLAEQGLKINPFSSAMYSNMWCAYFAMGKFQYSHWCAARQVLLAPRIGLGYIQWISSAVALGNNDIVINVFKAMLLSGADNAIYFDSLWYQEFMRLRFFHEGESRRLSCTDISDTIWNVFFKENDTERKKHMSAAVKPAFPSISQPISKIFTETGQFCVLPLTRNSYLPHSTKTSRISVQPLGGNQNVHYVAFKDNYGFIPFHWIEIVSRDKSVYNDDMEKILLHSWFVATISPIAFGCNYGNQYLEQWVETVGLLRDIPSETDQFSADAERRLVKLIFQVFDFVMLDKSNLSISMEELISLYKMSNPIASGRRLLFKAFGGTTTSFDDDEQVLVFLASLLIGSTPQGSGLAFTDLQFSASSEMVICLRKFAKEAMAKGNYSDALQMYRKALIVSPIDPILFSNIAQVYIKMKNYELARWFALRAIWLDPGQPKNHCRWCAATAMSGNVKEALAVINAIIACMLKSNNKLNDRLFKEIYDLRECILRNNGENNNNDEATTEKSKQRCNSVSESRSEDSLDVKFDEKSNIKMDISGKVDQMDADNLPTERHNEHKHVVNPSQQPRVQKISISSDSNEPDLSTFEDYLRNGSKQLLDNLYKSAAENYAAALAMVRKKSHLELSVTEMDEALIKYCFATACMRRHTYEHLDKAINVFDEIICEYNIPFPMAYYGKGFSYVLLNKFADGVEPLQKALNIVDRTGVHLDVHVYPGLPESVITESCREYLRKTIVDLLATCHSSPLPVATCHAHDTEYSTNSNHTSKIYCNDPEFQGYVRVSCRERCHVEFHPRCFKEIVDGLKIHGDKNVMGHGCLTPDCYSVIVKLEIFGSDGLVRKTLEENVQPLLSKTQPKNKAQIHKETIKKGFKKRFISQSSDSSEKRDKEITLAQLERERCCSLEPKPEIAVASALDDRSAENALLILKKSEADSNQVLKKLSAKKRSTAERRLMPMDINCTDYEGRIFRLQAEREANEAEPLSRVYINPNAPFSNPFQFQSENIDAAMMQGYLLQALEESLISETVEEQSRISEAMIEDLPSENVGLMTTVIDFMKQFVAANGPISLSSSQFLDFVNCIPIEVQELISLQENGILGLLKWSTILFIGDVAFTRDKLLTDLRAGSSCLISCLDLPVSGVLRGFGDSSLRAHMKNLRRTKSVPCSLHLGHAEAKASEQSDHELDASEDKEDEEYLFDSDLLQYEDLEDSEDEAEQSDDDIYAEISVLKESNRVLRDQVQFYKDKLFAAQIQTNLEKNAKREEIEKNAELERKLNKATANVAHINGKMMSEIKVLKDRLAAQVAETRSIEGERRKCSDMESEMADLRRSLAATELNHGSLVNEHRDLMNHAAVLECDLEQKVNKMEEMAVRMQTMAERVDKMAIRITGQECAKPDEVKVLTNNRKASFDEYSMESPTYGDNPAAVSVTSDYHSYRIQTDPREELATMPSRLLMPPPPPPGLSIVPKAKVPLLSLSVSSPALSLSTSALNELYLPVEACSSKFADESASCHSSIRRSSVSSDASGSVKINGRKKRQLKSTDDARQGAWRSPSPSPSPAPSCRSSVYADSDGGQSYDSNVIKDSSLPYSSEFNKMNVAVAISTPSRLSIEHSGCQTEIIFAYLCQEFPCMSKVQFFTYFQLAKSKRKSGSLTGLRCKDIIGLIRPEILRYLKTPIVKSSKASRNIASDDPPTHVPSFWSDGPGGVPEFKKKSVKKVIVSGDDCAICLEEIEDVHAHYLGCPGQHCYHSKCIRNWYAKGGRSCPKCATRVSLYEDFPTL